MVKQTLYYNKIYLSDNMETNDILSRIKLMMNYDSKKTLTENREILIESVYDDISNKLRAGATNNSTNIGTSVSSLDEAFELIRNNIKTVNDVIALRDFISKQKPGGYSSLEELLNGELGMYDCDTSKKYATILNSIEGIKATSECVGGSKNFDSGSFTITYQPTQKPAENKQTEQKSGLGNKITDYPICVQERAKISKLTPTASKSGQWSVDIGGIYYYSNGRTYNPTTKESGDYHCGGTGGGVITPGKSATTADYEKARAEYEAKLAGSSGNSKSGNKTPYNWKGSPAVADVQSGKSTIVYGMSGDSVIEIQRLLNASGAKLREDGKFGGGTYRALTNFQKKSGTTNQKGVVDADTYNKLKGGGGTDEFATTDVEGKFGDSQSSTPVSQLVTPKSGESTPEPQSAGKFT